MYYRRTVLRIAGFVTGALLLLFSVPAGGTPPPRLLNFSGVLNGLDGNPVADGNYSTIFSIYDVSTGGTAMWSETQPVTTLNGRFNVLLGSVTSLPANLFSQDERYLGVAVAPDAEMTPRTQIVSVGNAFHSLKSDSAGHAGKADSSGHSAKADSSKHSAKADSAGHSSKADKADSSKHAARSARADTADVALSIVDDAVGSAQIINGSIELEDIGKNDAVNGQVMKWDEANLRWVAAADETGGGGTITGVTAGNGLKGREEAGEVTLDIDSGWVDHFVDTSDARYSDSTGLAASARYSDSTGAITDGGVDFADIGQNTATPGQVMKWDGTKWVAANDEGVVGAYLPVAGGTMTGAIISTGSPSITMGKGNFGSGNTNTGMEAFVAGSINQADGPFSTIGGGEGNATSAMADHTTIGGGYGNASYGRFSTVGGGRKNLAMLDSSTVGGGASNVASGIAATVGGGTSNQATAEGSTVPGGAFNTAGGSYSLAAGLRAKASHTATFVWADGNVPPGPGFPSTAPNQFLIHANGGVGIGTNAPSTQLDVEGTVRMKGFRLEPGAPAGYVLTSTSDTGDGTGTWQPAGATSWSLTGNTGTTPGTNFIGTTDLNAFEVKVNNSRAFRFEPNPTSPNLIGGHSDNAITGGFGSFIGGGGGGIPARNTIEGNFGMIGGGYGNKINAATFATIAGGEVNSASASAATVGGGFQNTAGGSMSTVSGGFQNTAGGSVSTVGGGRYNQATSDSSTIAGGGSNVASGTAATVGGGTFNQATAEGSTVPGGVSNTASGTYSFAAGRRAQAVHSGTFVWNSSGSYMTSTAPNQFLIRASGGVGIGTTNPAQQLDVAGTVRMTGFSMPTSAVNGYVLTSDGSGTGTWQANAGGDITGVTAGNGLKGGGFAGNVTLYIDSGWVNNFVDTSDARYSDSTGLAASARYSDSTGAITDGGVDLADIGQNDAANGQVIKWNGTAWAAAADSADCGWVDDGTVVRLTDGTDKVGIGTTTPNEQLEITGNLRLPPSTASVGVIKSGGAPFIHSFGTDNTFIGRDAGNLTMAGTGGNTASGVEALHLNTTGYENTAGGFQALYSNTDGHNNIASGYQALFSNTSGRANTASGVKALSQNTTGFNNTASGIAALQSNTTGDNNTAIGWHANVSTGDLTNATAIGANAVVNASYKIRLGDAFVTVIEGQVAYTFTSDENQKENFRPVDGNDVLRKIRELGLTSWNYKGQDPQQFRHYGPVAQEFFAAFGHDGVGTSGTPTTINSGDEAGILMIAVQALEKKNEALEKRTEEIAAIRAENQSLQSQIAELREMIRAQANKQ